MYFEVLGSQSQDAPTIVLSSGLGGSAHFWQPQLPALMLGYRIVVYDQNGTGRSPATLASDYSIQSMTDELLALLDSIKIKHCHFIGHALGGLVGLQIALQRPQFLQSLIVINAWSSPNPHSLRCFEVRKTLLLNSSPSLYLQAQALFLYPPDWIMQHYDKLLKEEQHLLQTFPDQNNLLIRIKALSEFDIDDKLSAIQVNTLVLANKDDMLVPWQRSQQLANALAKAQFHLMDYGGHASTVTVSEQVNTVLLHYLDTFTS